MGGLPAWEGGHPGRHAGWKPALLKEERDARHGSLICSRANDDAVRLQRIVKRASVLAIVVWNRDTSEPDYQDRPQCDDWEGVVPELEQDLLPATIDGTRPRPYERPFTPAQRTPCPHNTPFPGEVQEVSG